MGQSSSTSVLVVAKHDPQDPIVADLKRAGYRVLRAESSAAASRSLARSRPQAMVVQEQAMTRREAETLTAAAAQRDIPVLVVSHAKVGASRVSTGWSLERLESLLAQSSASDAGSDYPLGPDPEPARPKSGDRASSGSAEDTEKVTVGGLTIDLDQHVVSVSGSPLDLTATEFELLCHFARQPGRVWSRQQLIDLVWGYDYVEPRLVTVHIGNLRKKLGKASKGLGAASAEDAVRIETVRSVGYRLAVPSASKVDRALSDHRPRVSGQLPFVGRERELVVLHRALNTAIDGRFQAVAIAGEPGIGKTRLAEEVAAHAQHRGFLVYWGKCRDAVVKPAYEPWVEIEDQWKRDTPAGESDQVFVGESPGSLQSLIDGESARVRLFARLTESLIRKAKAGPLCLVIDDLHWADTSTLLALRYVMSHLTDVPLLLILTYRQREAAQSPLVSEVINDLLRGDLGVVLPLDPLSSREVGLFVKLSLLDEKGAEPHPSTGPERLVDDVYRETEGNPFFMTQLMRLYFFEGESPEASAKRRTLSRDEGVHHVVLSRLSRLSGPCREALDVAGVIGREFSEPVLAKAMDLPHEPLLARLAEAVDSQVLQTREDTPESYRFVHSIFQDVVRGELAPQQRATLHARVGTVLEHMHADDLDACAADLAHHFSEAVPAGFASQAVDHCLRAGRVADSQCAWEEACSHLDRATGLMDLLPADAPQRDPIFAARVWEDLGIRYDRLTDNDQALRGYGQALRRIPPEERLWQVRVLLKVSVLHMNRNGFEECTDCLAEAEALLGSPEQDNEDAWWDAWIAVQRLRGWVYFHQGRLDELFSLLSGVSESARTHGGPRERGHFLWLRMISELARQRWVFTAATLELAKESAQSFRAAGAPEDELYAERTLATAAAQSAVAGTPSSTDERRDAKDQVMRFLDLSKKRHAVWLEIQALELVAIWHRLHGDVRAVQHYAQETLSVVTERPGRWAEFGGEAKGHLSWVAWRAGDLDRARALASEALPEVKAEAYSPDEWHVRWTLLGLGLVSEDWGEASLQAEAMLDRTQQKMPDDLEVLMQRLVEEHAQGRESEPGLVEDLVATARSYGYL